MMRDTALDQVLSVQKTDSHQARPLEGADSHQVLPLEGANSFQALPLEEADSFQALPLEGADSFQVPSVLQRRYRQTGPVMRTCGFHEYEAEDMRLSAPVRVRLERMDGGEESVCQSLAMVRRMAAWNDEAGVESVIDCVVEGDVLYVVMIHHAGCALREWLDNTHRAIAPGDLDTLFQPMFHALEKLHAGGLVHGAITEACIRVDPQGSGRLHGFQLARQYLAHTAECDRAMKDDRRQLEMLRKSMLAEIRPVGNSPDNLPANAHIPFRTIRAASGRVARTYGLMFWVILVMLLGADGWSHAGSQETGTLFFRDPYLDRAIRNELGIPNGAPVTIETIRFLFALNVSGRGIRRLDGIEGLTYLHSLNMSGNKVRSLEPLGYLPQLWELDASRNRISDLQPARNMKRLRVLNLTGNRVLDASPLAALSELKELDLSETLVTDIQPLLRLKRLKRIALGRVMDPKVTDENLSDLGWHLYGDGVLQRE